MLPTGTVTIDPFLSRVLIGKANSAYIADNVLPPIFSPKLTGRVAKMGEAHYRIDFAQRAIGTAGNIVNWDVTSLTFAMQEYRLEHPIDDTEKGLVDDPFDLKRDAQMVLWHKLMLKKELDIASMVMASANYPVANVDATNRSWNVPATGKPVDDIQTAVGLLISTSGVAEDRIYGVCSYQVFQWLRTNDQIKSVFLSTTPGAASVTSLTRAQVASVLGLAGLEVGTAIQNTAKEGATATKAYVWGNDDFAIYYKSEETGIMVPNFGYGIYPRIPGLPGAQVVSDVYRREDLTSDMVRSRLMLASVVADSAMGFLFTSVDNA